MGQIILAAYSGLIVTALMVLVLGLTIINQCYKEKSFGTTFWISVSFSFCWLGEFLLRLWWTLWRDGYMARQPVSWMIYHPAPLVAVIIMMAGGLLFIKTMTENSHDGRLWKICACVILCVIGLAYFTA